MGKKDSAGRVYFSVPERFADLVNRICFKGKQVLRAEDLKEVSSNPGRRTRDVVKIASFGAGFAIIGGENQETVDYSLPLRIMESDLADYRKEAARIKRETDRKIKEHDPAVNELEPGERLYRFPKDAKLMPVITIILSNAEHWDGPRELKDMLELKHLPKALLEYVSSYKLNIVEIPKLTEEETSRFRTDLRQVMDLLRCISDGEKLEKLLKENGEYSSLASDAYDLMKEYVDLEKYGVLATQTEGRKLNMRNGLDEIVEKYQRIGEERGITLGEERGIKVFIQDKLEDRVDLPVIKERLIRRFSLEEEQADRYLEKYAVAEKTVSAAVS